MTTQTYDAPAATATADLAALILRVAVGTLFVLHFGLKFFVFTPTGTVQFFQSLGLPGPFAYLIMAAELIGGLSLIAGFKTRLVSLALIPILLGAIATVHFAPGFFFMNQGGGWEFPAFWIVALVVQALLGDGAYALGKR
ncbi:MAG: DoxX family protein [Proteobacteria bacterium]|nr:DoxX family protein [Pseudomonadota bacterium]MBS0572196.1 DoxX family protein [Pseudomonadota bacterium]